MSEVVIVGLLSLAGTCIGSVAGILAANRLTNYRIEQLEKKVDKHNGLVERMVNVEKDVEDEKRRVGEIEKKVYG